MPEPEESRMSQQPGQSECHAPHIRSQRGGGRGLRLWTALGAGLALATGVVLGAGAARAEPIHNPLAVFSGLDKITGRIISFEVAVNETVQFGALQLTPRICNTRPSTEAPNTTAFVEIFEITFQSERKRLFEGWMFAASPGLHGVEHPVYDVWLTACKGGTEPAPPARLEESEPAPEPPPPRRNRQR